MKFEAAAVLSQEHLPVPAQPLCELQPGWLLAHEKGMDIWKCSRAHWRVTLLLSCSPHPCSSSLGNTGKAARRSPDKGIAQGGSAAVPSHSNDSLEHSASLGCCQPKPSVLPSCIQGDRIVTAHLPLLPVLQPLDSVRPGTPFPAWILSLEKRDEIFFLFLSMCR